MGTKITHNDVSGLVCMIKTGTYTGNDAINRGITGIGFAPKLVRVYSHLTAVAVAWLYEKLDQSWADYALIHKNLAGAEHYSVADAVNSLDADGFTVEDGGTNSHPNQNAYVYDYIALG